MIPSTLRLSYFILVFAALSCAVSAQYRFHQSFPEETAPAEPPPAVLYPEPTYWYLGLIGGVNINRHNGDFVTPLCDRSVSSPEGTGIHAGIQLEHRLSDEFHVALKLLYNDFTAKGETSVDNYPTIIDDRNNGTDTIPLLNTFSSEARLSYLVLNPMIQFFPVKNLYIMAGAGIGFNLNAQCNCMITIPDEYYFVEPGTNTVSNIYPEEWADIPDPESIRIDLRAGIGYNLRLGRRVTIAPEVGYIHALTNVSSDDNWIAHAFSAVAVLKIHL